MARLTSKINLKNREHTSLLDPDQYYYACIVKSIPFLNLVNWRLWWFLGRNRDFPSTLPRHYAIIECLRLRTPSTKDLL
mgnify:CR=1 FL=1